MEARLVGFLKESETKNARFKQIVATRHEKNRWAVP